MYSNSSIRALSLVALVAGSGALVSAQPTLLRDIVPGSRGSNPSNFVSLNGVAYFTASGRLWRTDGSRGGTRQVTAKVGSASDLTVAGSHVYFAGSDSVNGRELWVSDGTDSGTHLVRDINPGRFSSNPRDLTRMGSGIAFTADNGVNGREIWRGGTASATLIRDLAPGSASSRPHSLTEIGSAVVFIADVTSGGVTKPQAWLTTGIRVGTSVFLPTSGRVVGVSAYEDLSGSGAYIVTRGPDEVHFKPRRGSGVRLMRGTAETRFARVNGVTVFASLISRLGKELMVTDNTSAGTKVLKDLNHRGDGDPRDFVAVGDSLYFTAVTAQSTLVGRELWKTDGTGAGTTFVKDVLPGTGDGVPRRAPRNLTAAGDLVVFAGAATAGNVELFASAGTASSTIQVGDINPGGSSNPLFFHALGDTLLFMANDGVAGSELWSLDLATLFGGYQRYGSGCGGTGRIVTKCLTFNATGGSVATGNTASDRIVAAEFPAHVFIRRIVGYEFPTRSITGSNTSMTAAVHLEKSTGGPSVTALATARMPLSRFATRMHRVVFPSPVIIPPNTKFYLTVDANVARLPYLASGDQHVTFSKTSTNRFWRASAAQRWRVNALCQSLITASPKLSATGEVRLGKRFSVQLSGAAAGAQTSLLVGLSDQTWGSLQLPFEMSILGARFCHILAAGDFMLSGQVDNLGEVSHGFSVPNEESLLGLEIFNQFAVFDAGANALGVSMSNAGKARVGR